MDEFVTTQRGTTRRDFLKAGGALVVSFSVPGCAVDNAHGTIRKGLGVEAGRSLCVFVVPHANRIFCHCVFLSL